ncbi:putative peroxiredoxin [Anaplasma centrale str. Israel]|uniref:thioredoxin-dependent peroxiredoxin n=1 Tax=Anaplasma centrale (strain Israel) TaxID=574556 RepID=D1AUI6_ANACI|nr:peroxiredoxin [Anaplasma centrale]ACZ49214.1 putative peroxiredoxin [Anaplasma centrale str. Israel]
MDITEGGVAPEFVIKLEDGTAVPSSAYVGKKNIVLYFYPKDDTPGCTKEAEGFRDAHAEFAHLDTVIIGVSGDGVSSHANFRKKYQLPFELIPDEDSSLSELYGTWVKKHMFGKSYMGIERSTFLIDKHGKIRKIWRNVKVDGHVNAVLDAVKSL